MSWSTSLLDGVWAQDVRNECELKNQKKWEDRWCKNLLRIIYDPESAAVNGFNAAYCIDL